MPKYSKVMIGFGAFLIICGLLGWASAGFEAKARTAVYSGGATGILMIGMGFMAASPKRALKMIGIHLGIIFPLVFAGVFIWRASLGWSAYLAGEPKLATAALISLMAAASLVTFVTVLRMRPKPEARGRSAEPSV